MKTARRVGYVIISALLITALMLSLTACSTRLSGTYSGSKDENSIITTTFVFEGKTVKKSQSLSLSSGSTSGGSEVTGVYDISYVGVGKGYEITFVWDATKTTEEKTETFFFKKTAAYIQIGDVKYTKQVQS